MVDSNTSAANTTAPEGDWRRAILVGFHQHWVDFGEQSAPLNHVHEAYADTPRGQLMSILAFYRSLPERLAAYICTRNFREGAELSDPTKPVAGVSMKSGSGGWPDA